jgi:peptidoglycan hydrolase-like protein with peptidoglycan-binding domain
VSKGVTSRRRIAALGTAGAVMIGGLIAAGALVQGAGAASPSPTADERVNTARVERRTLTVVDEIAGQLGHGDVTPIHAAAPGTVTELADLGSAAEAGSVLYRLDDRPVVVLIGEVPAWRTMGEGAVGRDVEQLESNLAELGFGDDLSVDERWDAATTAAVREWQESTGTAVDARVDLGDVVFVSEPVRVAEHAAALGAHVGPGAPVVGVTTTQRTVTLDVSAAQRDVLDDASTVTVELLGGAAVEAEVTSVAEAPTTDSATGEPTYRVTLAVGDDAAGSADGPVTVHVVRQTREDVLAVPANALLALLEGGYALERSSPGGGTELVPVEIGLFADGWVEVRGELAKGDEVITP